MSAHQLSTNYSLLDNPSVKDDPLCSCRKGRGCVTGYQYGGDDLIRGEAATRQKAAAQLPRHRTRRLAAKSEERATAARRQWWRTARRPRACFSFPNVERCAVNCRKRGANKIGLAHNECGDFSRCVEQQTYGPCPVSCFYFHTVLEFPSTRRHAASPRVDGTPPSSRGPAKSSCAARR